MPCSLKKYRAHVVREATQEINQKISREGLPNFETDAYDSRPFAEAASRGGGSLAGSAGSFKKVSLQVLTDTKLEVRYAARWDEMLPAATPEGEAEQDDL